MGRRGNGEGSIYKRDVRRKRADGTVVVTTQWCAAVTQDHGPRKMLYGKTRQDVAGKLRKALERKAGGLSFLPERRTVGEWVTYWLETMVRAHREPTTYAMYETVIRRHLLPYLAQVPLNKLQPEHVERWQRELEANGVSVENQRSAMVRLRTALNVALKRQHVERNVATLVERPRVPKRKRAAPRIATVLQLLKCIREDPLQALVYVALGGGLRRAEVLGLHWEDIDLDAAVMYVRRRVNRVGKGIGLVVRDGAKTASGERTVILPRFVVDALRQRRRFQFADRQAAGVAWKGPLLTERRATGFVFTSEVGTVLEPRRVDQYFAAVRARVGLDAATFHGLRHDFAGLQLQTGTPPRVVSEMMGHADYSITANHYQHVGDDLQRLAADRLDALLQQHVG